MICISLEIVLGAHSSLERSGKCLPGVRNANLLESAIMGQQWYRDNIQKVVHVAYSINAGHIFVDGNKRTCYMILKYLCTFGIMFDEKKLRKLVLTLAEKTMPEEMFYKCVLQCIL